MSQESLLPTDKDIYFLLKSADTSQKLRGISILQERNTIRPEFMTLLQEMANSDPSEEVRAAAATIANVPAKPIPPTFSIPTEILQTTMTALPPTQNILVPAASAEDTQKMIALLQEQNNLLKGVHSYLRYSLEKEKDEKYRARVNVTDFHVSFGSIFTITLKWMLATFLIGLLALPIYYFIFTLFLSRIRGY